jgi:hypothetical protein
VVTVVAEAAASTGVEASVAADFMVVVLAAEATTVAPGVVDGAVAAGEVGVVAGEVGVAVVGVGAADAGAVDGVGVLVGDSVWAGGAVIGQAIHTATDTLTPMATRTAITLRILTRIRTRTITRRRIAIDRTATHRTTRRATMLLRQHLLRIRTQGLLDRRMLLTRKPCT